MNEDVFLLLANGITMYISYIFAISER